MSKLIIRDSDFSMTSFSRASFLFLIKANRQVSGNIFTEERFFRPE